MSERTVTLVGNNGQREVLACPGGPFELGTNSVLWGTSPVIVNSGRLGGLPGEVVSSTGFAPRELLVTLVINEDSNSELDNQIERLTEMVRVNRGDVHLEVATTGTRNTNRTIFARYISGLDAVPVRDFDLDILKLRLRFTAHDPFWTNTLDTFGGLTVKKIPNAIDGTMDYRVFDPGSTAEVWPTWTITGITENIMASNVITGQSWRFTEKLEKSSDVLEIRTDPRGEVGAFVNGGQRLWAFDADSEMWPLLPQRNIITFSGLNTGTSAGNASIGSYAIRWQNRFENC